MLYMHESFIVRLVGGIGLEFVPCEYTVHVHSLLWWVYCLYCLYCINAFLCILRCNILHHLHAYVGNHAVVINPIMLCQARKHWRNSVMKEVRLTNVTLSHCSYRNVDACYKYAHPTTAHSVNIPY